MKKKVSWWKSKYSDYTHLTEDEDYLILHLKSPKPRNGCCQLDKFLDMAEDKGKRLLMSETNYKWVVMSIEDYEMFNKLAAKVEGLP